MKHKPMVRALVVALLFVGGMLVGAVTPMEPAGALIEDPNGGCIPDDANTIDEDINGNWYLCRCVLDFETGLEYCVWISINFFGTQRGQSDQYAAVFGGFRGGSHGLVSNVGGRRDFQARVTSMIFSGWVWAVPQPAPANNLVTAVSSQTLNIFNGQWEYCTSSGIQANLFESTGWTTRLSYGSPPCGPQVYRTVATGLVWNPFSGQWVGNTQVTDYLDWTGGCGGCLQAGGEREDGFFAGREGEVIENPDWVATLPPPDELKSDPLPEGATAGPTS